MLARRGSTQGEDNREGEGCRVQVLRAAPPPLPSLLFPLPVSLLHGMTGFSAVERAGQGGGRVRVWASSARTVRFSEVETGPTDSISLSSTPWLYASATPSAQRSTLCVE